MQTRYMDGPRASLGATQLSKCHTSPSLRSPPMTKNNSSRCRAQAQCWGIPGEVEDAVLRVVVLADRRHIGCALMGVGVGTLTPEFLGCVMVIWFLNLSDSVSAPVLKL